MNNESNSMEKGIVETIANVLDISTNSSCKKKDGNTDNNPVSIQREILNEKITKKFKKMKYPAMSKEQF